MMDDRVARFAEKGDVVSLLAVLEEAKALVGSESEEFEWELALALYWAASGNRIETLSVLLEQGIDPNTTTTRGHSALCAAASGGKLDAVRFLVEHGADPELPDRLGTASRQASLHGHREVAEYLNFQIQVRQQSK